MKRLWIFAVLLVVPLLFAAGQKEETMKLVVLMSPEPRNPVHDMMEKFADDYGVEVEVLEVDVTTGTTITMDTMVAAGEAPDVYMDYLGRAGKYITPDYALPLDEYINMTVYNMAMEKQFIRDGKLYALARGTGAQGLFVNLDIMDAAGIAVPDSYTIEQYLAAAKELKKRGEYMTVLFAANQSGDYQYMNYFASFNARLYNDDYTESLADSPEGLAAMQFLNSLVQNGYAPKESAVYSDDDALAEMMKGNAAVAGLFIGHLNVGKSMVEQGIIESMPRYKFTSFPNNAAACSMPHAIVGHKSEDGKRNELTAKLIEYIASKEVEEWWILNGEWFPTRKDVTVEPDNEDWRTIKAIVDKSGFYDLGLAHPKFGEIRQQMFPLLQEMYRGRMTPEEAIKIYDEKVTAILGEQ